MDRTNSKNGTYTARADSPDVLVKRSETIELQTCEHCSKDHDIETMRAMEGCWFCTECIADFKKHFDACDHKWLPHVDEMGDHGQYCVECAGFVRNEDFPALYGTPAPMNVQVEALAKGN